MEKVRRVVLICDISGFMRLARSLADRMPVFLQAFYEMVGDVVVGLGGTLVKYIGDAVLCTYPDGRERDAINSALGMRGAFSRLLDSYAPDDGARLEVAISSGEVMQGTYGHATLLVEDIMGEAVSRVAMLNRHPGIKVGKEVHDTVVGAFRMQQLPSVPVKWSDSPIEAWLVLDD